MEVDTTSSETSPSGLDVTGIEVVAASLSPPEMGIIGVELGPKSLSPSGLLNKGVEVNTVWVDVNTCEGVVKAGVLKKVVFRNGVPNGVLRRRRNTSSSSSRRGNVGVAVGPKSDLVPSGRTLWTTSTTAMRMDVTVKEATMPYIRVKMGRFAGFPPSKTSLASRVRAARLCGVRTGQLDPPPLLLLRLLLD